MLYYSEHSIETNTGYHEGQISLQEYHIYCHEVNVKDAI